MSALKDLVNVTISESWTPEMEQLGREAAAELDRMTAVIKAVKTKVVPFLENVQNDLYCDNDGRGCGCNSEAKKLEAEIVSILAELDGAK